MNQDILKINNIPGKNIIFHSPIENENILIRTGIQKSQNFLSAVLYGSSTSYSQFNQHKQEDIAKKINKEILQKKLNENDIALKILLKDEILNILSRFYDYIVDNKKDIDIYKLFIKDNNVELLKIITELYNKKTLIKDIEQYFEKNNNFNNILEYLKNNFENILKLYPQIPLNKKNYCITKLENVFKIAIKFIQENNLNLENISIDEEYIKNIMENVNRNIYIIDSKTRLPYKILNEKFLKYSRSLILLKIDDHYENIGIKNKENIILRDFDNNDEIILILNSYLYNRNNFNKKYNIKYSSDSDSNSNSESDSDNEYFKNRRRYLKTLDIGNSDSEDN